MFDFLPLGALIDNSLLALHGGISPSLHTIDQLRVVDRFKEIPEEGLMCDIMWADPVTTHAGFRISSRGAGYTFGEDVLERFLRVNGVKCVFRSHQLCEKGYEVSGRCVWVCRRKRDVCGRERERESERER